MPFSIFEKNKILRISVYFDKICFSWKLYFSLLTLLLSYQYFRENFFWKLSSLLYTSLAIFATNSFSMLGPVRFFWTRDVPSPPRCTAGSTSKLRLYVKKVGGITVYRIILISDSFTDVKNSNWIVLLQGKIWWATRYSTRVWRSPTQRGTGSLSGGSCRLHCKLRCHCCYLSLHSHL